jgi:two-component system, NtrC family, response regulator HydG
VFSFFVREPLAPRPIARDIPFVEEPHESEPARPVVDGPAPVVLVVDDDRSNLESVERILTREGYRVLIAPDGASALDAVRGEAPNVVITDLMMPGLDGASLLKALKAMAPHVEVILMTAYGTVEGAVAAMKEGAYDFLTKPLKRHAMVRAVRKALEKQALVMENQALRAQLAGLSAPSGLVGQSPLFRATVDLVRQVAASNATVLVQGETGTGKELVARAIHELSPRNAGPFVAINCAALPETILESELFGYERGAFTGANARKEGRFDRANRGTLFLDEVAEMSPTVQAKLLRVVQDGEFERLGGTSSVRVDVRLIAATNRDLAKEVAANQFREDLFYRLNVVGITLPPLRDRLDDVPLLADHFLRKFAAKHGRELLGLSREAVSALQHYSWPGNVRELENTIERSVVLSRGGLIGLEDLPVPLREASISDGRAPGPADAEGSRAVLIPLGTPLEEVERRLIRETLRYTRGDKTLAARLLGIAPRTIYRKMDRED